MVVCVRESQYSDVDRLHYTRYGSLLVSCLIHQVKDISSLGLVIGIEVMVLTQLDKASRPLPKSTVKIIWSPLLAVTRYEVNITELESGLVAYHNFTKAPPLRIEQSLNHYTRYSVTVTAHSTGGHGPASKEKTFLTDEGS